MVRMLFRPFRIGFWLTLGFAAFLSEGLSHLPRGGGEGRVSTHGEHGSQLPEVARGAAHFLLHPVWGALVIAILVCATIAILVFMWISSRGKFIFLDDVLRERAAIVEPWKRFAGQGDSLFVFWLALTLASIGAVIALTLPLLPAFLAAVASGQAWPVLTAITVSWWVAAMVPLGLFLAYTHLFLFHFVVPIMYRDGIGVLAAWGRFLALFRMNVIPFLVFGLFFLILQIAVGVAVVMVGFSTCCVGFVLMAIPYVSSVVLLPVDTVFRGLGPDFLTQFGPGASTAAVPPAGAPPASGAGS
jgi:hypothetical protein